MEKKLFLIITIFCSTSLFSDIAQQGQQASQPIFLKNIATVEDLLTKKHQKHLSPSFKQTLRQLTEDQKETINVYHLAKTLDLPVEIRWKLKGDIDRVVRDEEERDQILTHLRWVDQHGTLKPNLPELRTLPHLINIGLFSYLCFTNPAAAVAMPLKTIVGQQFSKANGLGRGINYTYQGIMMWPWLVKKYHSAVNYVTGAKAPDAPDVDSESDSGSDSEE